MVNNPFKLPVVPDFTKKTEETKTEKSNIELVKEYLAEYNNRESDIPLNHHYWEIRHKV